MSYNQRVTSLISEYNRNPHLFNEDQLDELEELAEMSNIEFTRKHDDFSFFSTLGQLSTGFVEGLTTLPVGDKPTNTYERIAHSLGHLAGFAPSIMSAPAKFLAKKAGGYGLAKTAKALEGVGKFGDLNISAPMLGSKASKSLLDRGLEKSGLDAREYLMKGSKTRGILEEAVGLGTASTISGIWEGPDAYLSTFTGGAIAGGLFGGIGNFVSLNNMLKGSPEQAKRAEAILKTSLGASVQGLPAYLRDEPIEMIMYETILGGFFGYKSRPAHEAEGSKFVQGLKDSHYPAEAYKPETNKDFKKYTPKAQEYIKDLSTQEAVRWAKVQKHDIDLHARNYLSVVEPNKSPTSYTQADLNDAYRHIAYNAYRKKNPFTGIEIDINNPDLHESKFEKQQDVFDPVDMDSQTRNLIDRLAKRQQDKGENIKDFKLDDIKVEIDKAFKDGKQGVDDFLNSFDKTKSFVQKNKRDFIDYYQKRRNSVKQNVYAIEINNEKEITVEPNVYGDFFGTSVGMNYTNLPANYLMKGGNFKVLTHARSKDGEVLDAFDKVFKGSETEMLLTPKNKGELYNNLHKENKYLFSGLKDNGKAIIADYHLDANPNNLNNVLRALNVSRDVYDKHFKDYLNYVGANKPNKEHINNHSQMWMSNVLYMAEANGLHRVGDPITPNKFYKLVELKNGKDSTYGKNVIDFNKRTQLIGNRFFPQNPRDYINELPNGKLKYVVLKDNDVFNNGITNSATDGSGIMKQQLSDRAIEVNALPSGATFHKPVFVTKNQHGMHYMKLASERANNVWQEFMDFHGIDVVFFQSATKHLGTYSPVSYKYNKSKNAQEGSIGRIEADIKPESILEMPVEHWRISSGTTENVAKSVKGNHSVAKQMSTNLSDIQTPKAIERFFKEVVERSADGFDPKIKKLVESENWFDNKELMKLVTSGDMKSKQAVVDNIPISKIIELHTKHRKHDLTKEVAKVISKTDSTRDLDSSIEFGGQQWKNYHERSKRLLRVGEHSFGARHLDKLSKDYYEGMLTKYIMHRYTRPNWKYSGKGIFGSVTEDVFHNADRLTKTSRPLTENQIILGNAFREMPVKPIVYKNKNLTTLGEVFDAYRKNPSAELKDALNLTIVRIPMDSVSGARVVDVVGFLKDGGTKVVTHNKQDRYMGGADKDIDSMFLYQGFSKKLKKHYKDLKNEWELVGDKSSEYKSKDGRTIDVDRIFGSTASDYKDVVSKFSPSMRMRVAESAKEGKNTLKHGVSQKSFMTNLADLVSKKGYYEMRLIKKKKGKIIAEGNARITLKDNESSPELMRYLGREIVNRSADSADYSTFNTRESIVRNVFNEVFNVEISGKNKSFFKKLEPFDVVKESSDYRYLNDIITPSPKRKTAKGPKVSLKYWELAEILKNTPEVKNDHITARIFNKLKKDGFVRDVLDINKLIEIDKFLAPMYESMPKGRLKEWAFFGYKDTDGRPYLSKDKMQRRLASGNIDYGQLVNTINNQFSQIASVRKMYEVSNQYTDMLVKKLGKAKGEKKAREEIRKISDNTMALKKYYKVQLFKHRNSTENKAKELDIVKNKIIELKEGQPEPLKKLVDYILLSPQSYNVMGKRVLNLEPYFHETLTIPDSSIRDISKSLNKVYDSLATTEPAKLKVLDIKAIKESNNKKLLTEKTPKETHQEIIDKLLGADPITSKATTKQELEVLSELRGNFDKHFRNKADIENFFTSWTYETGGLGKTLETANVGDLLAFNGFLKSLGNPKEAFKFNRRMYMLSTPMGESERQLKHDVQRFEAIQRPVLTSDGVKLKPVYQYTSTFGALRKWMNNAEAGSDKSLNAYLAKSERNLQKLFKYRNDLPTGESDKITKLVHNIRQNKYDKVEYDVTKDKLYKELPDIIKVDGKSYTKKELIEKVNKDANTFFEGFRKEWINDGKTESWLDRRKDGTIDVDKFVKKYIDPNYATPNLEKIPFDVLKRVRFQMILDDLKARGVKAKTYNKIKEKLKKDADTGKIEFDKYFPHTNFGYNSKAKKQISEYVDKEFKEVYTQAKRKGKTEEQAFKEANARKEFLENHFETSRNDSQFNDLLFESLSFNKLKPEQIEKRLDHIGFGSAPDSAKSRTANLKGYDTRSSVFDTYAKQWVHSNYRAQASIMAHYRIADMMKRKAFDKDVKLTKKQLEHYTKAGYSKEAPITEAVSDYLRFYVRDSFGHHSFFEQRIADGMNATDPLKLKKNLYYLSSDQALVNGIERIRTQFEKHGYKMPFMKDLPSGVEARKKYYARMFRNLGTAEARFQLLSLLSNTGTMTANIFGGTTMTISSAGFRNWVKANDKKFIFNELLKDTTLNLQSGAKVKNMKDLRQWVAEKGVIDTYIKNELEVNPSLKKALGGKLDAFKSFTKEYSKLIKQNPDVRDETVFELANRFGVKDAIIKVGALPMTTTERYLRFNSYLAHAIKARDILGKDLKLDDPFVVDYAMKGIEATQFLYSAPNRPAFMRTSLGKVLGRFKTFAYNSVRTRKELYKQAKLYGFKEGTDSFNKFKDLFIIDMFTMALGSMFAYSLFDTALPPPYDWLQETSQWLFGDKRERDRAFFGQYPYPIAPLQIITPPVARIPMSVFSSALNNDWERFMDYHIHTMYPFGRVVRQIDQTFDEPYGTTFGRGMQQFFRLPTDKLAKRYKKSQLEESKREYIEGILDG